MKEIITLKLYTDFDKLQCEFKKCFRFETFDNILQSINNITNEKIDETKQKYETSVKDLKKRLNNFYHWRGTLLIELNKFGTKLNTKNNMILYHGVNAKMIFNGPLSTTSSYHVAKT
eukprot:453923_1